MSKLDQMVNRSTFVKCGAAQSECLPIEHALSTSVILLDAAGRKGLNQATVKQRFKDIAGTFKNSIEKTSNGASKGHLNIAKLVDDASKSEKLSKEVTGLKAVSDRLVKRLSGCLEGDFENWRETVLEQRNVSRLLAAETMDAAWRLGAHSKASAKAVEKLFSESSITVVPRLDAKENILLASPYVHAGVLLEGVLRKQRAALKVDNVTQAIRPLFETIVGAGAIRLDGTGIERSSIGDPGFFEKMLRSDERSSAALYWTSSLVAGFVDKTCLRDVQRFAHGALSIYENFSKYRASIGGFLTGALKIGPHLMTGGVLGAVLGLFGGGSNLSAEVLKEVRLIQRQIQSLQDTLGKQMYVLNERLGEVYRAIDEQLEVVLTKLDALELKQEHTIDLLERIGAFVEDIMLNQFELASEQMWSQTSRERVDLKITAELARKGEPFDPDLKGWCRTYSAIIEETAAATAFVEQPIPQIGRSGITTTKLYSSLNLVLDGLKTSDTTENRVYNPCLLQVGAKALTQIYTLCYDKAKPADRAYFREVVENLKEIIEENWASIRRRLYGGDNAAFPANLDTLFKETSKSLAKLKASFRESADSVFKELSNKQWGSPFTDFKNNRRERMISKAAEAVNRSKIVTGEKEQALLDYVSEEALCLLGLGVGKLKISQDAFAMKDIHKVDKGRDGTADIDTWATACATFTLHTIIDRERIELVTLQVAGPPHTARVGVQPINRSGERAKTVFVRQWKANTYRMSAFDVNFKGKDWTKGLEKFKEKLLVIWRNWYNDSAKQGAETVVSVGGAYDQLLGKLYGTLAVAIPENMRDEEDLRTVLTGERRLLASEEIVANILQSCEGELDDCPVSAFFADEAAKLEELKSALQKAASEISSEQHVPAIISSSLEQASLLLIASSPTARINE
jgi:hypothetical protein